MRHDVATNKHWGGRYRKFGRKYSKVKFIRKIFSQTEKHKQNILYESGVEYVDWTELALDVCQ